MSHQMITVMLDQVDNDTQQEFQKQMESFKSCSGKQGDEAFYKELCAEDAQEILRQSCRAGFAAGIGHGYTGLPGVPAPGGAAGDHQYSQQQGEEDRGSRSPSQPQGGFVELLTYPPPPSKGTLSITNKDLDCLQDGVFLNDVIIDFYLKYLLLEKLSAEDRARTHVFSSYFYFLLTHTNRGGDIDEDHSLSRPEKRHALVKRWTRHVDLFQKDFIIIPINKQSHWFLAIVCFPGMNKPEENLYIPRPLTSPQAATGTPGEQGTSVPTPPPPGDEPATEEMETDESQAPVPEAAKNGSQPPAATGDPPAADSRSPGEENKDKPEDMDTGESQQTTPPATQEARDSDTMSEKNTEVNGSEEASEAKPEMTDSDSVDDKSDKDKVEEDKDKAEDTSEKDKSEDKSDKDKTEKDKIDKSDKQEGAGEKGGKGGLKAPAPALTTGMKTRSCSVTPTSSQTGAATTSTSTTTATHTQKTGLYKMGSRGQKVTKEEAEKLENVANGMRRPCILVFDSLSDPSRKYNVIVEMLKDYLLVEWTTKKGLRSAEGLNRTLFRGFIPKVPQQNNYSDCGVYLLQYVESFFQDPIQDFTIPIKGLHDWFSIPKIEGKRKELRDLIIGLKEKQQGTGNTS